MEIEKREKLQDLKLGIQSTAGSSGSEFVGRVVGQTALLIGARLLVDFLYRLVNGKEEEE